MLAAALLYLRSHLAGLSSTASDAGSVTGLTVQLQSGISPAAIASWDVLAQTTLLGLVLFRMGGLLLGSGPKAAALFHGRHGELGVKDLERFAGASAAGIWGSECSCRAYVERRLIRPHTCMQPGTSSCSSS